MVFACLLVAVGCGLAMRRPDRVRHRLRPREQALATVLLTALVCTAVVGLAVLRTDLRTRALEEHLGTRLEVVLTLGEEPQRLDGWSGDRFRAPARLVAVRDPGGPWESATAPVLVLGGEEWTRVDVGERVLVAGRLAPTAAGDPVAALLVAQDEPVVVTPTPAWQRLVNRLRSGLVTASSPLAPQARGLVPGITLGDTRALPAELEADLRTVNLTHVTAVSGAHVAIILGAALLGVCWLPRTARVVIGGLVLLGFVALVHPSGSVLRSATMGAVMLVGMAVARPRATIPALWVSTIVLLAVDPWLSRSFGFVLSVLATGGLLLWAGPIAAALARFLPRPVALALAIPVAAQLACGPVILLLQPGLSAHGVLANLLSAPAVPPATVLGVVATLVGPIWPGAAVVLAGWAGTCTAWIASVATWTAGLPAATLPWPGGLGGGAALVVLLLATLLLLRRMLHPG